MWYKEVDGVKFYATDRVMIGDAVVFNPTDEQLAEAGFIKEVPKEKTKEELLAEAKEMKLAEIEAYDKSDAVNNFTLDGMPLWLPQEVRISVMNSTNVRKQLGLTDTTLWLNGMKLVLPCDLVLELLAKIENYALLAFDTTEEHKANVRKLTNIEDVEKYDYTKGYPVQLNFKIP
nr:MAG TPA: protein of unknown function (DUF4376) [Bacteriophage sp.]